MLLSTSQTRIRACADDLHEIKDRYGLATFHRAYLDWILRKLVRSLKGGDRI